MNKYPNTCVTCLSNDRTLVSLSEMSNVLLYIHFTELNPVNGGICWECKNTMMKFYRFKHKALQVHDILSMKPEVENLSPLTNLGIQVNVPYDYHYNYNDDPLICDNDNDSKIEIHIKEEITNSNNDLPEIEDSDNNLPEEGIIKTEIEITEPDVIKPIDNIRKKENKIIILKVKDLIKINKKINALPSFSRSQVNIDKEVKEIDKEVKEIDEEVKEETTKESDIYTKVIRTEDEVMKYRDDRRNHTNYKRMPYKCELCVIGYTAKETYDTHMLNKHFESQGQYPCNICTVQYESPSDLEAHRQRHYVYYKCNVCEYTTVQLGAVMNHCKQHESGDNLRNVHELKKHTQTRHNLNCHVCGRQCKDLTILRKHIARIHSDTREFICDICKQTFITKSRLEMHMTKHSALIAKKMCYCSECDMQFKTIYCYRAHLNNSVRHAEKNFPCPDCGKEFSSKGYCKQHYEFIHLRKSKFHCEPCDKPFRSANLLRTHNQIHHGLSRSRDHVCNECGKKFFTNHFLRQHSLIHSADRTHMCAQCGDTFKQKAALYNHTKLVHEGKKKRSKKLRDS